MITLIHGDEEFLIERKVQEIAQANLLDNIQKYSYPDHWDLYCSESTYGWNRSRVLHVLDLGASKLADPIPDPQAHTVLLAKNKTATSAADQTFAFPALKTFSDNNDVVKWIVEEGRRFNIDLRRAAHPLFLNCGNGLRKLHSEIEKISQLVPAGAEVNADVLRQVLSFSAEFTPQPIVEAIVSRSPARALSVLSKLQEHKDETGWILAYLIRTVYQVIQLELLKGLPSSEAATIMGIHPYVFSKTWEPRRGIWKLDFLFHAHRRLLDLDSYHKKGGKFHKIRLEKEILDLCTLGL